MKRLVLFVGVTVLALASGFWFAQVQRNSNPMDAAPQVQQKPAPTRVPEFRLADLAGEQRSIREWWDRPLIINFWATWCAPCRREMPLLEALHQAAPDLAVIGVAIDREEPVQRFIGEIGVSYPILRGEADAMALAESFGSAFAALPFTVIAAPGGEILKLQTGELHPENLEQISRVLRDIAAGRLTPAAARRALAQPSPGP